MHVTSAIRNIMYAWKLFSLPEMSPVCMMCDCTDASVSLKQFDATVEGLVQQYVHSYGSYDSQLEAFWEKNRHFW